ncbi:unnamed protein product [Rhizopus stolonifer]
MAEGLERFKLPLKWKPSTDLMSKMLLSDPEIMRIIIHSLIGVDVSPDSYSVVPTEWADGSRSDMVYASTKLPPPILIEVQYQVNQDHSHQSFSSAEFQNEFTVSAEGLLLETVCKFWAKKYFLLTTDAVSNHFQQATLNPMAALDYFITLHTMNQVPQQHWRNPTLA